MGMYLGVYQIVDKDAHKAQDIKGFNFDTAKWVDDRKFEQAAGDVFENEYISCDIFYCCAEIYWRPKNLVEAIDWVTENIKGERKDKLTETLKLMETNKDWYFNYS